MSDSRPVELTADDLMPVVGAYRLSAAVLAMLTLGIPDALASGPRTAHELAGELSLPPVELGLLLRMLASRGALVEEHDGAYRNSALADAMRDRHTGDMIAGWAALPEIFSAWASLAPALRRGTQPFREAFGDGFHEYLAGHDATGVAYSRANASTVDAFAEIAACVDLTGVDSVAALGGLTGTELVPILEAWPDVEGILVDLPSALHGADVLLSEHGLSGRVRVVEADVRTAVPAAGAYVASTLLRCLDDGDVDAVLRNCAGAGGPGARVYVAEMVVPPGPATHPSATAALTAWVVYGGRDRTIAEWESLHNQAGLEIRTVTAISGPYSVIASVVTGRPPSPPRPGGRRAGGRSRAPVRSR